jgi:hypothetical protein
LYVGGHQRERHGWIAVTQLCREFKASHSVSIGTEMGPCIGVE